MSSKGQVVVMKRAGNPLQAATSRRRFLQSLGTGMLAPLVLPGSVLGRDGGTAPSARITVGLIGVGNQGNQHLGVMLGIPEGQVVAACDPVRAKREAAQRRVESAYTEERGKTFQGCAAYCLTLVLCSLQSLTCLQVQDRPRQGMVGPRSDSSPCLGETLVGPSSAVSGQGLMRLVWRPQLPSVHHPHRA